MDSIHDVLRHRTGKILRVVLALAVISLWPAISRGADIDELQKRAQQGDASAQYYLGDAYYYGKGVPQDDKKAGEWFLKAAAQGHAAAQHRLALCFWNGKGVPKDPERAFKWCLAWMTGGRSC
jgi:hypothetical protein